MYYGYDITSIRILPSDKVTFPKENDFKEFVEKTMPRRGGYYYFPNTAMRCTTNSLILFQYGGKIRAAGVLVDIQKRRIADERGVEYSGYYKFDTKTLRYLTKSIDKTTLQYVYPAFASFNQSKQNIPMEYLDSILELLIKDEENDVEHVVGKVEKELDNLNIHGDSREAIVKVRVNQGVFRDRLLQRYDKCCLCGVKNAEFLIASHIKPWSKSAAGEKLDVNNGFLMCPNHDRLFDKGWVSFDNEGNIMVSNQLEQTDKMFMNVSDEMKICLTEKNKEYLEYHRKHVFLDNRINE